jgi:tetratricopeptide (TPR) repeat protein
MRGHYNLARAMMVDGDTSTALEELRLVAGKEPTYLGVQNDIGMLLGRMGNNQEAGRHFLAEIRNHPAMLEAHFNYSMVLMSEGKGTEALAEMRIVHAQQPKYPNLASAMGGALVGTGHYQEAIVAYQTAMKEYPDSVRFIVTVGEISFMLRRYADAVTNYQAALRRDPNSPRVHAELGMALHALARNDEAIASFEHALALDPSLAIARNEIMKIRALSRRRK